MGRLTGKVALITGGGGGIGEATGRLFVEEGARVALVDSDAAAAERAVGGIDPSGEKVLAIGTDLTIESNAAEAVAATVRRFGRLDVLANVAGVRLYGPITEATPESWDFIIKVNLLAAAYVAKFAIPEMRRVGGGSIVNVSSQNALVGRPEMPQYDATKAALLGLTRDMAAAHGPAIRVNAICPGSTITGFHIRRRARAKGISEAAAEAEIRGEGVPHSVMNRPGEPREIAYAILFLACDESSFVTGATLVADGGYSAI